MAPPARSLPRTHTHARSHPPARRAPRTPPHAAQLGRQQDRRFWHGGSRQGAGHEPAHRAAVRARAAGAAPPLPAPRRHPLALSLANTPTPAPPPAAPPARRRASRSLDRNPDGDAGAAALAKALATSQLTMLLYVHAPLAPPRRCLLRDDTRSLSSHTRSLTPARPLRLPHATAHRTAWAITILAMMARQLSPRRWPRASSLCWGTCTRRWRRPAAARCSHGCGVPCACARCSRRAAAPCAHHSRPPCLPFPLPCSHFGNDFGGKCGTGSDSPSGAKGALCDAWRAKHGDKASFNSYGMTVRPSPQACRGSRADACT